MKKLLLFFALLTALAPVAQASLSYQVGLQQLVSTADAVVSAEIISKEAVKINRIIYTDYQLQVTSTWKGAASRQIRLRVEGGNFGTESMVSSASPNMAIGEKGVYFLNQVKDYFELNAYAQSVFRYDEQRLQYISPYYHLTDESLNELFHTNIHSFASSKTAGGGLSPTANPLVMSVSPLNITAGTESVLTILGTGFGSAQTGKVYFANPDDAGSTYVSALASKIQSWTDTKITVVVPSQAGTGNVWVQQNGVISKSVQVITIAYSRSNAEKDSYQNNVNLVNQSKTGGYFVSVNDSFAADSAAYASFKRALQKWRCTSGINFTISDTTSIDAKGVDNVSVIRYATKNELKQGVLGITYSYYSSCNSGYWYLTEFDMNMLDTNTWNFDTITSIGTRFDFESVVLHELGHAHQLSHVINSTNIMHYAIAPGSVKRVIDADSKACADLIVIDSEKNSACGPAAHRVITSEYCEDLLFTYFNFEEPVCYPNPNEGQLTVSFNMPDTSIGSIKLYDMFGHEMQRIFDGNFNAGRNNYLIDLSAIAHYTGVYVIQISAQNKSFLKKLIYLSK